MLWELIFLVGGLLVGVTSSQVCSVCGDGYQVGTASAIGSVPGLPPATCDNIELAGRQGLIPIDQCISLPLMIFETCKCQINTSEAAPENPNASYASGHSSLRRVQYLFTPTKRPRPVAAPFRSGSTPPVRSPFYSGSTPVVYPFYYAPSERPVANPSYSSSPSMFMYGRPFTNFPTLQPVFSPFYYAQIEK